MMLLGWMPTVAKSSGWRAASVRQTALDGAVVAMAIIVSTPAARARSQDGGQIGGELLVVQVGVRVDEAGHVRSRSLEAATRPAASELRQMLAASSASKRSSLRPVPPDLSRAARSRSRSAIEWRSWSIKLGKKKSSARKLIVVKWAGKERQKRQWDALADRKRPEARSPPRVPSAMSCWRDASVLVSRRGGPGKRLGRRT